MRARSIMSLLLASLSVGFVSADFHYGTLRCSEAGGGSINAGFILPPPGALGEFRMSFCLLDFSRQHAVYLS